MAEIIVIDEKAVDQLGADIRSAKQSLISQLAERGYKILAGQAIHGKTTGEVPFQTGNLQQGIAPPKVDLEAMTAEITVSGRKPATGARTAQVFGADGKPTNRTVSLRPSPAFNYAESVEKGRPSISPKVGHALLIPLPTAPTGESYLMSEGQVYIVRKSAKGVPPNPFMERTAKRLEGEAPRIAESILNKFV